MIVISDKHSSWYTSVESTAYAPVLNAAQASADAAADSAALAQLWSEGPGEPGGPGTHPAKYYADLAASASVDLRIWQNSDAEMALETISPFAEVITRFPKRTSAGQVAPVGQLSFWKRASLPTMDPYFTTVGPVVWTPASIREDEILSILSGALSAYVPQAEDIAMPDSSTLNDFWNGVGADFLTTYETARDGA